MHLVVLRKNNIDLPETLPPCLVPPRQSQVNVAPAEPPSREESPPSLSPSGGEPTSPPRSKEVWKLKKKSLLNLYSQMFIYDSLVTDVLRFKTDGPNSHHWFRS